LWAKIILLPLVIIASIQLLFIAFSALVAGLGVAQAAIAAVTE